MALAQSEWVAEQLHRIDPDVTVELMKVVTKGDRILDKTLAEIGGKGLFCKEIEEKLYCREAHLAVHSIKDLPADLPPGLHLSAIPEREDPRDALVSNSGVGLADLPPGSTVGTASLRRASQVLAARPDLKTAAIRGNVDTRLRKLAEGQYDAVILAAAGLKRLGLFDKVTEPLGEETMLPAVGQGALGLETLAEEAWVNDLVGRLNHPASWAEVEAERAFLARLEGSCHIPAACRFRAATDVLTGQGLVARLDGGEVVKHDIEGPIGRAAELGRKLADLVLNDGGREILAEIVQS